MAPRPLSPGRKASLGAGGCLALLLGAAGIAAFNGWLIMLLWGAIAPQFDGDTIGFGTAVLIGLALTLIGGFFKKSSS